MSSISDKINKATDEKLTSENWEYIISACDSITGSDEPTIFSAFTTIRKRLASPAGNTQLYTLTLLNALAQSGDRRVKTAVASPETRTSLEKVAKASHNAVKQRVNDILDDLAEAVGDNEFTKFTESIKNRKHESITPKSKVQDEEEEQFQRALRLSMQDPPSKQKSQTVGSTSKETKSHNNDSRGSNNEIMQKINKPMPPTPQEIRRVKALYEFKSTTQGDLSFKPGQVITIIENNHKDWWKGTLDGEVGIFPANYVEYIKETAPTTEEEYIFAQAPNVEKLLSIFASASKHPGYSIVGNQNIQTMYDEVLSLRPQLIRLIDEYSARKQKLMQLNRDVMEARSRYEGLVNARMSGGSAPGLGQYSQPHSPERPRQQPGHLPDNERYGENAQGPSHFQYHQNNQNAGFAPTAFPQQSSPYSHSRQSSHYPSGHVPGAPQYPSVAPATTIIPSAPSTPSAPAAPSASVAHPSAPPAPPSSAPHVVNSTPVKNAAPSLEQPFNASAPPTHGSTLPSASQQMPQVPYTYSPSQLSTHSHSNSTSSVVNPAPAQMPTSPNYNNGRRTSNPSTVSSLPYPV